MAIPGSAGPFLLAQLEEEGGYEIERSLRFNSSDSAYLSRTPASAGNRKTWTFSCWVKKTRIIGSGSRMGLFGVGPQSAGAGNFCITFDNTALGTADTLSIDRTSVAVAASTAVFRDPSAWFHVVAAVDTTLASGRVKVYVNGTGLTAWSSSLDSIWSQNEDTLCNSTNQHRIGQFYQNSEYFDGYLADPILIDGQALTPSSFGQFDTNGVWQPKAYSGSYGTNGFHLDFADNSAATATTLGKDTSGNGNDWTPVNLSLGAAPAVAETTVTVSNPSDWTSALTPLLESFNGNAQNMSARTGAYTTFDYTVTFSPPVAVTNELVGTYQLGYDGYTVSTIYINGGAAISSSTNIGNKTDSFGNVFTAHRYATGAMSISTIRQTVTAGYSLGFLNFMVDNKMIVDSTKASIIAAAAGKGNDSLVDSPTNYGTDTGAGGEVRGNYATLNPLFVSGNTLSNGNLDVTTSTTGSATSVGTIAVSSGKWYWEVTPTTATSISVGVLKIGGTNAEFGSTADGYAYLQSGSKYNNGSSTAYGASYTSNDVIGIALDLDAGTLVFYKNNTSQGTAFSSLSGTFYSAVGDYTSGSSVASVNFGQRPFAYTAPSGFKALCTANLPSTTITTSGSYTGNGVADGPFVYLNGVPTAMTVDGNAVTFGTHADKLSNGFKVRTTSTTYNQNASTYNYTITTTGDPFKTARAQANP